MHMVAMALKTNAHMLMTTLLMKGKRVMAEKRNHIKTKKGSDLYNWKDE